MSRMVPSLLDATTYLHGHEMEQVAAHEILSLDPVGHLVQRWKQHLPQQHIHTHSPFTKIGEAMFGPFCSIAQAVDACVAFPLPLLLIACARWRYPLPTS